MVLIFLVSQKSKTLGLCNDEFAYRMVGRDAAYEKLAAEVRKGIK
jgi:hypothetical protein